jgi:uncharacterized protein (DUF2141 family)
MNKITRLIPLLLLWSCAQMVTPDGGEKDITAPKIISTYPQSGSINTSPKKIKITFDENITLKNKAENIFITPSVGYNPEISSYKRTIEILLKPDSFIANTTYAISFGKSIVDINEGNCLENYFYCFSTGTILDSSIAYGKTEFVRDNLAVKKASVKLTNKKNNLRYTTYTDEKGLWTINNLPIGVYTLEIYLDNNNNKKLDPTEYYYQKLQEINDSFNYFKTSLIPYSNWDTTQKLIVKAIQYINSYSLGIVTNKPLKNKNALKLSIENEATKKTVGMHYTNRQDSFIYYHPFIYNDSVSIIISGDTLQHFLVLQPKKRIKDTLTIAPIFGSLGKNDPIQILSNIPLKLINSEKIIVNNSNQGFTTQLKDPYHLIIIPENRNDKTIIFLPGALTDIDGIENKRDSLKFKQSIDEETGNFEFSIKDTLTPYNGSVMVKIYNENNTYTIQTELSKINKLNGLLPGNYSIEVWYDDNNSESWDSGNYLENIDPEKILHLKNYIIIKPNWDSTDVDIYMN